MVAGSGPVDRLSPDATRHRRDEARVLCPQLGRRSHAAVTRRRESHQGRRAAVGWPLSQPASRGGLMEFCATVPCTDTDGERQARLYVSLRNEPEGPVRGARHSGGGQEVDYVVRPLSWIDSAGTLDEGRVF